jgi:uncharacterized protein (TIGR04255 family)
VSTQGDHPVYPNPSVTHVVLEVRFPSTTTDPATAEAELRAGMRERFPLADRTVTQNVTVDLGGGGSTVESGTLLRFQSRDRTQTVVVAPDAVTIETTQYLGLAWYLDLIRAPVEVVASTLQPDAIVGMGHRFIDEVRVPDPAPVEWGRWIDSSLLAASALPQASGLDPADAWFGAVTYRTGADTTLTLRHGPMEGPGVKSENSMRRSPAPANGPFFLLDWDSRWAPEVAPEFTADAVLERCEALYAPVRSMFHHLLSDELVHHFETPLPNGAP